MCGILGLVSGRTDTGVSVAPARIAKALLLQNHRGPDLSRLTFFSEQPVSFDPRADVSTAPEALAVFGHNRLCIIDLSENASQPMPYQHLWLTYNGEIYNYQELRSELESQGARFKSASDSEMLLALYARDGADMVHRLNGMFAFAIWDAQKQTLFMARDRYGIKPLYYSFLPSGELAFSSEIKSLIALGCDKALDYEALSELLTFQNIYEDRTLLKSVRLLQAGHRTVFRPQDGQLKIGQYWEPVFNPQSGVTESDLIAQVRGRFETAVSSQLVGDVPIGSFLSGGMDTGAITAVTTRTLPGLHTFTAGFDVRGLEGDESLFDERDVSRELADRMSTRHHEMLIAPNAMPEILPQVTWHLDDFRVGISYQNWLVSKMVREHVIVVLSGVGGDELFAGYTWRYEKILNTNPASLQSEYYQAWVRLLSEEEKNNLFTPEVKQALGGFSSRDGFNRVFENCRAEDPLNKALCFDMKTFLHGLLIVEDRLSMAHSVESRVPFLDNDLVDLCLQLPPEIKLRPGVSKWILKEALRGLLPDEVLTRRKQGFTPPDASWYRGAVREFIESLLLSDRALARGLFLPDVLRAILDDHFSGRRNHRFLIWTLMNLEMWHRHFIDPADIGPPPALPALTGARIS